MLISAPGDVTVRDAYGCAAKTAGGGPPLGLYSSSPRCVADSPSIVREKPALNFQPHPNNWLAPRSPGGKAFSPTHVPRTPPHRIPRPLSVPDYAADGSRMSPKATTPRARTKPIPIALGESLPPSERATPTHHRRRGSGQGFAKGENRAPGPKLPGLLPGSYADDEDETWDHYVFMDCDSPPSDMRSMMWN